MNVTEQIEIMKYEARIANRAKGEGIRNWTPEARAASLAKRRAEGSVWGWNHRTRATPKTYTTEAFNSSMDALNEDSAAVRQSLAIQAGGGKVLSARPAAYDEIAAQRLEAFKAWLAEVKRTETAIDDFNGIVAAAGGLMGVAGAKRGQGIGSVTADAAAEAAAKKVAFEKSIRRSYEKRNADYLRKNPDERGTMLDMVAEKAEYYSSSTARKVEIEKDAYRQIRDGGPMTMREYKTGMGAEEIAANEAAGVFKKIRAQEDAYRRAAIEGDAYTGPAATARRADYTKLLEAKRSYVREREAIRPQLQADESAYPVGNGIWIGRLPNGDERVISAIPDPSVLPLNKPGPSPKTREKLIDDKDWEDTLQDGRSLIGGRYYDRIGNRHTASCAASQSAGSECTCSCGGSQHGTNSAGTKITAVTDDGKRKSAGGTRADGTAFFASVGEDIGDGTTVVSVDVAGEKIRVRDKDGNEYDLAMNGQGRTGEKDPAATGYENNADLTEEEKARNKITLAFVEEMKDAIDDNEGIQDAMDVYDNEGAIGMSQEERMTVLEAMANNEKPSPELQRLQSELEAASDVFKQVKGELADLAKTQPVTLQNCLDQLKIDGDKDLYKIKVDALGEIYDQTTREAFGDRAADSVTQEEWTAMQDKLGIPKEMQSDHNPDSGIENRWSDAARAAALIARRAKAAARKSALGVEGPTGEAGVKGEPGTGKSMADYKKFGFKGMDSDWLDKTVQKLEERAKWRRDLTAIEKKLVAEYDAQVEGERNGSIPVPPPAKLVESGYMTSNGPVVTQKGPTDKTDSATNGAAKSTPRQPYSLAENLRAAADAREQAETEKATAEGTGDFDKLVTGFKKLISQGSYISSKNLQSQLLKDHDQTKFKLAKEALAEAWHTASLDRFQDKFGRDPNNNAEFRRFQKSIEVPAEYIGAGETK